MVQYLGKYNHKIRFVNYLTFIKTKKTQAGLVCPTCIQFHMLPVLLVEKLNRYIPFVCLVAVSVKILKHYEHPVNNLVLAAGSLMLL